MGLRRSYLVVQVYGTNGAAERCRGTLLRLMRARLAHARGDTTQAAFWPFLMLAAAQRHNSLFTFASTPPSIPIVVARDSRLSPMPLFKFKMLLCDCFVAVKKSEFLDKLSPRRVRTIHLGYDSNRRGRFIYILEL